MNDEIETVNKATIESFIVNNYALSQIEAHLNRFNPIKIMKMENMEIRHSSILSWLLNPRENHGLHDEFLRTILAEVLKNTEKESELSALDVYNANLHDANVYTEWNDIDIFIECPVNKWVFIIENKVYSTQSDGQLSKYAELVKKRFKPKDKDRGNGYVISGVFLSLYDEEPDDEEIDVKFHKIKYSDVVVLLNQAIHQFEASLSSSVLNFIKYYREIISELCDMNEKTEDMKKLARKVYQENKAVIDFIVEHSSSTEFQYAVSQLVYPTDSEKDPDTYDNFKIGEETFVYFARNKRLFSFLPTAWIEALGEVKREGKKVISPENYLWKGCETWWWSYPLICWIELKDKTNKQGKDEYYLKLYAEVGPYEDRNRLIDTIEDISELHTEFVSISKVGKKSSRLLNYKDNTKFILPIEDPQNSEELKEKMEELLDNFSKHVVDDVEKALTNYKS